MRSTAAGDGRVGLGEREEGLAPQAAENAGLGEADAVLDLGLVLGAARSGRQDADAVVRGHHAIAAVDLRVVERGLVDPGLQIVGHDQARHAAEEAEHADMRADPVRQCLGPGRLGIGEVRGAEHGDEDLRLADLAGVRIDDGDLLAGVVDEDLVAGDMILPHDRRQGPGSASSPCDRHRRAHASTRSNQLNGRLARGPFRARDLAV